MSSVMGGVNRTNSLLYLIAVREDSRNAQVGAALNNRMAQVATSTKAVGKNARGTALATRNLGYVAQNASYQIADFFVMMQGGVGVGRALATQLPQLLAGFGALGAVFGAVAAIGASVVVMLQQQAKATKLNTELVEKYGEKWVLFNTAQNRYLQDATYVNERLLDAAVYAERLAAVDLRAALQPPPVTGWDAIVGFMGQALSTAKDIVLTRFPINDFFDEDQLGGAIAGALIRIEEANDAVARSFQTTLAELASAERGTEEFFALLDKSGQELAQLAENPALDTFIFALTDVDQAEAQLKRLKDGLKEVLGEKPGEWGDIWVERVKQLEAEVEQARATFEKFTLEIKQLTTVNPETGILDALTRRSELDQAIARIEAAQERQIILWDEGDKAIAALVEIDRWEALQDVIIDIGKNFESQILDAMKSGKFAIKDFVAFALEQFAKLALARLFEPITLALANFVPSLGGTGSPSPGTGAPPIGGRMGADYLIPAPPPVSSMAVYGENMSKISGGRAAGGDSVTVNVNNYGNDEVEVTQNATDSGIEIDVLIKGTVAKGFASGDFDKVMQATFGARRLGY